MLPSSQNNATSSQLAVLSDSSGGGGSARHSPLSCLTVATVVQGLEFVLARSRRVHSVVPLSLTHLALALHSADVRRLHEEAQ